MSTAKTATDVEEFDFDSWTDEDENAALREVAAAVSIRYVISDNRFFVGRFPDGRIIKTPIRMSVGQLDAITAESDNELDQIKALLRIFGQEEDAAYLEQSDLLAATDYVTKYMAVFTRVMGITLGE